MVNRKTVSPFSTWAVALNVAIGCALFSWVSSRTSYSPGSLPNAWSIWVWAMWEKCSILHYTGANWISDKKGMSSVTLSPSDSGGEFEKPQICC